MYSCITSVPHMSNRSVTSESSSSTYCLQQLSVQLCW